MRDEFLHRLYVTSRKVIGNIDDDKALRMLKTQAQHTPLNRFAEAVATTFMDKATDEVALEPMAVIGLASFEKVFKTILSAIDSSDREHFLMLVLTAVYYKLSLGNETACLSDFHPSFINEEQDS